MEGKVQSGVGKAREAVLKLLLSLVLAIGLMPAVPFAIHDEAHAATLQNAMWFMDDLKITQAPGNDFSHAGTKNFDVNGVNNFDIKAPFDCKVVAIFNTWANGNTVIIQSTQPVKYANGAEQYMSIAFAHDNDISDIYIGKTIKQGQVFYQTGTYGNVTARHSHVTCIEGKYEDHPGWVQETTSGQGNWTFKNAMYPQDCLYISPSTNVVNTAGLTFKKIGAQGNMTMPTISTSSSNYVVGETVKMTWAKTSSSTDFYQYWVVVKNATTGQQIYAGAAGSTGNVNVNSYSFKASTAGTYNLDVWAVPYNDKSSRQKHASKTITVLPADTKQPTVSNVVALTGTDGKTRLEWCESPLQSANYDSRAYKLRVFSGVVSSTTGVTPIYEEELTGLYKELDLAPGVYTAYVRARNTKYDFLYSDPVYMTFTVPGDLRTTTSVESGEYYLRYADNTSLAAAGTNTSSGSNWASFELEEFTGADNQKLIVAANADGSYTIKVKSTGMFLNAFSGTAEYWYGLKDDTNVGQFVSEGQGLNEAWYFDQNSDGTYSLRSAHNCLYMTAASDNPAAGTDLRMFGSSALDRQRFVLEKTDGVVLEECEHVASGEIAERSILPSCTEDGSCEYATYCLKCEVELSRRTEVLPALGHSNVVEEGVEPTCTESGYSDYAYCVECGEALTERIELEALGHAWSEGVVTSEPDCVSAGVVTYTCENDETHTYTAEIEPLGHELENIPAVEPTCIEQGSTEGLTCTRCNEMVIEPQVLDALGHEWGEWVVKAEATETADGLKVRVCSRCLDVDTEVIPATGSGELEPDPGADVPTDPIEAFAYRLYKEVLGRDTDPRVDDAEGYWVQVNALRNGFQPAEIAYNYFNSEEYMAKGETPEQTVERVYRVMFGRDSDEAGKAMWVEYLECGMSVRSVIQGFSQAQEYHNYFQSIGVNDTTISPSTLAPRDRNIGVTQFVFRLYTIVLGRDADEVRADAAGLDVQTEAILNGVTAATIAQNVFGSQEYANRGLADPEQVRCAYMAILGRTVEATEDDVEGRTYWEGRLKTEGVLSVVYGFCQSQEFSDLCATYGVRPR